MASYFSYSRERLVALNKEKMKELWKLQEKAWKSNADNQRIAILAVQLYGIKQAIAMHDAQMGLGI